MLANKQDECIPISPARTLSGTTEHGVLSLLAGLGLKGIVLRGIWSYQADRFHKVVLEDWNTNWISDWNTVMHSGHNSIQFSSSSIRTMQLQGKETKIAIPQRALQNSPPPQKTQTNKQKTQDSAHAPMTKWEISACQCWKVGCNCAHSRLLVHFQVKLKLLVLICKEFYGFFNIRLLEEPFPPIWDNLSSGWPAITWN